MKPITYSKDALKTLRRMPRDQSRLITSKVDQFAADPASLANKVEAIKGEPGVLRLRVGDWRVLMEVGDVVAILRVGPRGGVYD